MSNAVAPVHANWHEQLTVKLDQSSASNLEAIAVRIESAALTELLGQVMIGKALNDARILLKSNNDFGVWRTVRLPWLSQPEAWKRMQIAEKYGDNIDKVSHLSFSALASLAAPSTPEPVREAVLERAASGETVTAKQIAELREKHKEKVKELKSVIEARDDMVKIAERQSQEAHTRAMFAESDKERLAQQIEDLVDEISRLKEDGVIHVEQAMPTAIHAQPARVDTMLIAMQAMWDRAGIETRNSFLDWATAPEEMAA